MSQTVLVTGGTGFIGRRVITQLLSNGRRVLALTRRPQTADWIIDWGAEPVWGNILDPPEALAEVMEEADTIFHVAGVNELCPRDPARMYRANVLGTRNVILAAAAAGVRRIVHTSSAATIGERPGEIGTESTQHRGTFLSHYEKSKTLAEHEALDLAARHDLDVVVVNPCSVQGPGRATGTGRLLGSLLRAPIAVAPKTWVSILDIDDCARGHLLAAELGRSGQRYVLCGSSVTAGEGLRILREVTGRPRVGVTVPAFVFRAIGPAVETIEALAGRRTSSCPEALRVLLHGHRYDGSLAARELGLAYTPLQDTIARTVTWLRREGRA